MIIYFIILIAIVIRFVTHFFAMDVMANFAPVTALAIFAAVYLPKKQAIAIPLAVRFVSDIFLGFFQWPLMVAVYTSHLVGILFGLWIRKNNSVIPAQAGILGSRIKSGMTSSKWFKIICSSLAASVIFFLVTNFAFLYPYYSHNLSGITSAYINGLPFFRGTLLGDMSYTLALFGGYELAKYLLKKRSAKLSKNPV